MVDWIFRRIEKINKHENIWPLPFSQVWEILNTGLDCLYKHTFWMLRFKVLVGRVVNYWIQSHTI